jgi:hypothetical protein
MVGVTAEGLAKMHDIILTQQQLYIWICLFLIGLASAPSCHLGSHTFLLEADAKKHANARHR